MILEVIGAFGGFAALITVTVSSFFIGGRRWRGNFDAEKASHGITKENLAAEREKVTAGLAVIEQLNERVDRMGERLTHFDEERKQYAGTRVYEIIQDQHQETLIVLKGLADQNRKMVELIEDVGERVVSCFGKD